MFSAARDRDEFCAEPPDLVRGGILLRGCGDVLCGAAELEKQVSEAFRLLRAHDDRVFGYRRSRYPGSLFIGSLSTRMAAVFPRPPATLFGNSSLAPLACHLTPGDRFVTHSPNLRACSPPSSTATPDSGVRSVKRGREVACSVVVVKHSLEL